MTPCRAAVASAIVTATLVVSGCSGEQPTGADGHRSGTAARITDDASGHPSAAHALPRVPEPPAEADWNTADATYLTMMVAHHSQALDLAELAETRALDPRVRSIAESIGAGQGREILVMSAWLVEHELPEPTVESVAEMTAMGMPGMLSAAQLEDLAAVDGATFDRRFLEDMIQHHQGAVAMAEDVLGRGEDVRVVEMATDVVAGQNAEIARIRELLADLP